MNRLTAMSREATLRNYLSGLKREYDYILLCSIPLW